MLLNICIILLFNTDYRPFITIVYSFRFTAFVGSTNPFSSTSSQWVEFEREMSNVPTSIFWAFDTTPTSTMIRPNELDIPVKSGGGGGQGNSFTVASQTNPSSLQSFDEAPLYINTLGQSYGSTSRRPCALRDSPLGALPQLFRGNNPRQSCSSNDLCGEPSSLTACMINAV